MINFWDLTVRPAVDLRRQASALCCLRACRV
ncbi:putative leader peptide [Georgenia faecalis]|uniref:Leader peptide n=1 Tax=Georgenia faecalis TaxID=2483799 RepID=A0ABV9D7F8_9MICO